MLDFAGHLPSGQEYDSMSLIGSAGAAYLDDHHNSHLLFGEGTPRALFTSGKSGLQHEIQEFVNEVARGNVSTTDAGTILGVHRVIEAVRRSLNAGLVLHADGGAYEPV